MKLEVAGPPTTEPAISTGPEPVGPQLAVEESGELTDGQSVTVTGAGFPAGQQITMSMCEQGVTSRTATERCDINALQTVAADATGDVRAFYEVLRVISTGSGIVDCAASPGRCVLGATHLGSNGAVATVPLRFGPGGAGPTSGQVTVSETENVRDDQVVTLRGTGFRPGDETYISQCWSGEPVDPGVGCSTAYAAAPTGIPADDAGNFTATFPAQRLLFRSDQPTGGFVDCLELSGGCELRVATLRSNPVRVPIAFDTDEPRPAEPTLTIDEPMPLELGQKVTVRGRDFQPGLSINIGACLFPQGASSNGGTCGYPVIGLSITDPSGSFVVTLSVIDDPRCAEGPDRCGLAYYPGEGTAAYARLPLSFDP